MARSLKCVNLCLNVLDLPIEFLIFEKFVAKRDAKLRVKAQINRVLEPLAGRFGLIGVAKTVGWLLGSRG